MSLRNSRLLFPAAEVVRELRNPLRERYRVARKGQDLAALHERGRRYLAAHPLDAVARLFGRADRSGPVWAVTMVRNEEARIEGSVRQLCEGGVDVVVVADNLSTDRTAEILHELSRDLPLIVVRDQEAAYYQGAKMSRLARAASRCGASWIVPFDADELWYGIGAGLADRLRSLDADAATAPVFDFIPAEAAVTGDVYTTVTRRTVQPVTSKVCFRAHLLATVSTGNHSVSQPVHLEGGVVEIRHYPYLGFDHFKTKMREGSAVLSMTNLPTSIGEHWRSWADMSEPELEGAWSELGAQLLVEDALPPNPFVERARSMSNRAVMS